MKTYKMIEYFMYMAKIGIIEIKKNGEINKIYDRRKGFKKQPKSILFEDHGGYLYASISVHYEIYVMRAHRIIWTYYKGKIPEGLTINHIDGNKKNNDLNNLELATMEYQVYHAINIIKTRIDPKKENNPRAKIREKDVEKIKELRKKGKKLKEIKRELNLDINLSTICKIIHNKLWKQDELVQT